MDAISQARLQLVHPVLSDKIQRMAAMLAEEKIAIRVVQGLRSWSEQDSLYAQGRTQPGKIVTNCPGGHSWHNFGMAVDCVPDTNSEDDTFIPDWNENHPTWERMVKIAESLGLECGADWRTFKDWPHFQMSGVFPMGSPNDVVRTLFKNKGMQGVWDASRIGDPVPDLGGEISV